MQSVSAKIPVFFHRNQLSFKPLYEWAFGEKIEHPETTARAESILNALEDSEEFVIRAPKTIPLSALRKSHSYNLLTLYNTAKQLPKGVTYYPSVFPKSEQAKGDPTNIDHAGCFCFDSGTPLSSETWTAATWSAACALEAAMLLRKGNEPLTYALSRPPGHHVSRNYFGGYSYFNNGALAARYLRGFGRVAILDIDFHHGNGTQRYFYKDERVFVISIHGDPRNFYPFFSGFSDETGIRKGEGFNLNFPLPRGTSGEEYLGVMTQYILPALEHFMPDYLIVSAGFDTYHLDPIGGFELKTEDFKKIASLVGNLNIPTVVVQEGGYYTPDLGTNVRSFLLALRESQQG
jgi:acetoin utilization deacetylase AcuC-like enzyme